MILYSVWIGWDYEGDDLVLLTADKAKALALVATIKEEDRYDHVYWNEEELEKNTYEKPL